MNPLTNVKNIQKLNQRELELGVIGKKSWHDEYKDSAWVFIGGLPYDLTEGDIVCVFSQYGEIVNINLVRDKATGKSKGFAFLCYEDQRSTVLAVDNLNSIKLLGRIIRVDHVHDYKKPKEKGEEDEVTMHLRTHGCAPTAPALPKHAAPDPHPPQSSDPLAFLDQPPLIRPPSAKDQKPKKSKKNKKEKKKKKKKKKMKVTVKVEQRSDSESSSDDSSDSEDSEDEDDSNRRRKQAKEYSGKMKPEQHDPGYDRALHGHRGYASSSRGDFSQKVKSEPRQRDIKSELREGSRHVKEERPDRDYDDRRHKDYDRGEKSYRDRRDRDEQSDRGYYDRRDREPDDRRDREERRMKDGSDRRR